MDIEKLSRKRQLNVQEQNILTKHRILKEASFWRSNGIPKALSSIFREYGINTSKCILIDYEQDFPGDSTDEGSVLTEDGKFYEFEADLNLERDETIELYRFEEITDTIEINKHKIGTGATEGFLALEVLGELNQC